MRTTALLPTALLATLAATACAPEPGAGVGPYLPPGAAEDTGVGDPGVRDPGLGGGAYDPRIGAPRSLDGPLPGVDPSDPDAAADRSPGAFDPTID
jgi:hypothetical protein